MIKGRELLRDVVDVIEQAGGSIEDTKVRGRGHYAVRWMNSASKKKIRDVRVVLAV